MATLGLLTELGVGSKGLALLRLPGLNPLSGAGFKACMVSSCNCAVSIAAYKFCG